MMTTLSGLKPSDLAPNLLVGNRVSIAEDAEIGANVILGDDVSVGAGASIEHGAALGRVPRPSRRSRSVAALAAPTSVGEGAIVCPYSVVDAGAQVGAHALIGNHTTIRGGAEIGIDAAIGALSVVNAGVLIGDRVRMQSHCGIGPAVVIEEDCFLGPAVHILTGRTMSSRPRGATPILRRGCQVGTGVRILPGVEVGEEAVIGAGAVVVGDVAPGTTVRGIPAREAEALVRAEADG